MKDAKITIEYITHCLASGRKSREGYDEFEKDGEGRLVWRQSWWYAAMAKSIELSGVKGVKPAYFSFSPVVEAPVMVYRRKYGYGCYRTHEAIAPGTQVVFDAVIDASVPRSAVERIFERMGKYVGLTPYGHNLGFGKFKLVSVEFEDKNKEAANEGQPDRDSHGPGQVRVDGVADR